MYGDLEPFYNWVTRLGRALRPILSQDIRGQSQSVYIELLTLQRYRSLG